MGRLSKARLRQLLAAWALPVLLAAAVLGGINSQVKADPAPPKSELQAYLQSNELRLFSDDLGNNSQIFYFFNNRPVQLTHNAESALHPISSGQYVAWQGLVDGLGQVFLYDVLSDSMLQLSAVAPNEGIAMKGNHVVWQGWDGQHWQIFYYNGLMVSQITNDATDSVNAATDGQQVLYAQQTGDNSWKAQSYDVNTRNITTIAEGDLATTAYPHFNPNGSIETGFVAY